jgi:large subunit ribosomal protein L15
MSNELEIVRLEVPSGAKKNRNRVGRGIGSGNGKTAGRGYNGQNSRKSGGVSPGFEGGQIPLYRRLPKRGFKNFLFKVDYNVVNLSLLNSFNDGDVIDYNILLKRGLLQKKSLPVKILGDGELTKKLEIKANKFSKSALEKIEKAGSKAVVI